MKIGAFTPCTKCGFVPASSEDQARSILLSDHNLDAESLTDAGRRIAQGDAPTFDEETVAASAAQFEQLRKHPPPGQRGCFVMQCILIGIMVALFIAVAYLYWYLKRAPNKATAPNAAMTLWLQIEHDWRGIGESRRWASLIHS
jgi:hypothetical protein